MHASGSNRMPRSNSWKREERTIARMFGVERNANNGKRQNDIDVQEHLALECKKRKDFPDWLEDFMYQAREGATKRGKGQLPIVVLSSAPGSGYTTKRYALMDLETLVALYNAAYLGTGTATLREGVADG